MHIQYAPIGAGQIPREKHYCFLYIYHLLLTTQHAYKDLTPDVPIHINPVVMICAFQQEGLAGNQKAEPASCVTKVDIQKPTSNSTENPSLEPAGNPNHPNLIVVVPKLPIPTKLQKFLLYDVDVKQIPPEPIPRDSKDYADIEGINWWNPDMD